MERMVWFPEKMKVCIKTYEPDLSPLDEHEIAGHTVCSLISAGTEINAFYYDNQNWNNYPKGSGYAAVFRVEQTGSEVHDIHPGDYVMGWLPHKSYQRVKEQNVVAVPETLNCESAPFARITAVSGASIARFYHRPGTKPAVVTGLGNVGVMAMQLYSAIGYDVVGTDVDENRVNFVRDRLGMKAYTSLGSEYDDYFGIALECSGTQQAVLECCRLLGKEGELSLVGVPWKQTADLQSYPILNKIFYKYLRVFSGWECDLPLTATDTQPDSRLGLIDLALRLLSEGKIRTEGLYCVRKPDHIQDIYDSIANHTAPAPSVILDWKE